jgi:outer membrane immunogenic protein
VGRFLVNVPLAFVIGSTGKIQMRSVFKLASMSVAALCFAAVPSTANADTGALWTGCYVGANGGYAWGQDQSRGHPENQGYLDSKINVHGGEYGGQAGCDYQFASDWVVGVQGLDDFASLSGHGVDGDTDVDGPNRDTAKITNLGSATLRLGTTPWQADALLYIKGGFAWSHDEVSNNYYFSNDEGPIVGAHQDRSGWTIGAGMEWQFAEHWSSFVEYDYYDFGSKIATYSYNDDVVLITQTANTAIAGVNFRF